MSKSKDVLKTGSGAPDARRRLSIFAPAAGRVSFAVPEDECSPAAVRQNTLLSASARGPVTGRGAHDGQRRLTISTSAAGHVRCTLPGTIDEEWNPEVDRQSNILSMSTHGGVTGSGAHDVRRKSNVSAPAARHIRFTLPGAVEEEEWSPAAIRQNTILSESACGLVTSSGGARDVQRTLNISTPAAGQERIAPPGADERRGAGTFELLYNVGKQIGKGGFGTVYEGYRKSDERKVAIKFILKESDFDCPIEMRGHAKPLYSEVAFNLMLLKPEKSPYIVEMLDWFEEKDRYIIILEFPERCMDLFDFAYINGGHLSETQARQLMRQAVLASMHCVDRGVIQMDLKPSNILVKIDTMELKLIDFGICRIVERSPDGLLFAVAQMVGELGVLLDTMVHGRDRHKSSDVMISRECQEVISLCTVPQLYRRPTFEEVLQHKWFNEEKVEVHRLFTIYGVEASRRRLSRRNRFARPRWSFTNAE